MSTVVQLEAFEASIRSRRIRWFLTPGATIAYPPGFQEQCFIDSPPFQRKVLLAHSSSSEAWKLVDQWDAFLIPTLSSDWSIALAVILNQPGPCIVLVTPEVRVPPAFFQKLQQAGMKTPTLVCFQLLTQPISVAPITFDATFFPPFSMINDSQLEVTQTILKQIVSSDTLRNFVLKDAIRDLQSAGATLVVSGIEDTLPSMYWYYASIPKSDGKNLLASILQTLLIRDK
jgi:hypothetical protein